MRKLTILLAIALAIAAFALSAVGIFAGQGAVAADGPGSRGPDFSVRCHGDVERGTVTCVLSVTGLPDPLQDSVSVTLLTSDVTDGGPTDWAPSATVASAYVFETTLDTPVFVARRLPVSPPPPAPTSPLVPLQPPQSV